jgi:hypothetical protein
MHKWPLAPVFCLFLLATVVEGSTNGAWNVRVRNEPPRPDAEAGLLSCRDRILADIELPSGQGDVDIKVVWFRPGGDPEQEISFPVQLEPALSGMAQAWLRLNSNTRSLLGEFSFGEFGGNTMPYNGVWTLELYVNDQYMARKTFEVACAD